jgi:signal transduction histidine kinase
VLLQEKPQDAIFQELESYRLKLYKWDKYLASVLPLIVLTYFAYQINPDRYVLFLGFTTAALIVLSVQLISLINFNVSKLVHFIAVSGVITMTAFTLPFIKYEYLLMTLTMLTVFSTYPFQKEMWNNIVGVICILGSVILFFVDISTEGSFPEYDTFNKVFAGVILYIATIEIIMTALIGNRYREIIQDDREQMKSQNEKLGKYIESNLQLENFAHIASHDLKTPLSNIRKFSQLLHYKTKDKLSQEEADLFRFIISGAQHMNDTINSLFQFSQASNKKLHFIEFSISELILELKNDISILINEKKAKIELTNLPEMIYADRVLVKQLFMNLILNAIKFKKDDVDPRIVINSTMDSTHWIFTIRDNGIGIDQKYLDSIFLIFKRLHTNEKYEGTGAGLAICKKIVEHHKGQIWVESILGSGSSFYFTIGRHLKKE